MNTVGQSKLEPFLTLNHQVDLESDISEAPIANTPEIEANSFYFSDLEWAKTYFDACHRDVAFKERWLAAAGSWDDKIVVDVGCGPGNLYANLGGKPKLLIGVDVARGSLKMAQQIGYTPLRADAHNTPLVTGFADIVAVNASLHHCTDMSKVLAESARLVRLDGVLVVDHDPQLTAWNYKGIGLLLYKIRLGVIYRFFLRNLDVPDEERTYALATEVHHQPGHGVTKDLFHETLEPMGFEVKVYPHNNMIGADALKGICGNPPHWRYRLGQFLSGINPYSSEAALSLMCVAVRKSLPEE